MLTRQELVKLIEAWPDENGIFSDPETYNAWKESEQKQFRRLAREVIGADRINALSQKQLRLQISIWAIFFTESQFIK